jgi:hypothetical protein
MRIIIEIDGAAVQAAATGTVVTQGTASTSDAAIPAGAAPRGLPATPGTAPSAPAEPLTTTKPVRETPSGHRRMAATTRRPRQGGPR